MENKLVLVAQIKEISELVQIRRTTKPDMYKKVLTLETSDGQVLYPEIRNNTLKVLDRENIEVGTVVEVQLSFQGSDKGGNKYNNILIHNIKKA